MALRVAVAGGGIGGLTAALCLARRGCRVDVFEQAPRLGEIGAGIQVSPNAMQVLRRIGVDGALEKVASEPAAAEIRHWATGKAMLATPLQGHCQRRYGAKYLHAHRADLVEVLAAAAAKQDGIRLHLGARVRGYRPSAGGVAVRFGGGEDHRCHLLVGADGIHSSVRAAMLGGPEEPEDPPGSQAPDAPPEQEELLGPEAPPEPQTPRFTGNVAWYGTVPAARIPAGLRPERKALVWAGPGRHFVAYYLRGGRLVNFVAVEERDAWAAESWRRTADMTEMRAAFDGWHPQVRAVLAASERAFLRGLFDRDPLPRWHDGRAALLGDACHPMLPFQAQGGAMAIEDAYVLAEACRDLAGAAAAADAPGPPPPRALAAALRSYEAARRPRATWMQQLSRDNAALFHAAAPLDLWKRQLAFSAARLMPAAAAARLDAIYGLDVTAGG